MSYAQNSEDRFILNYFQGFKGTLLEIGANDGMTLSNSRLLIEHGWKADLVEPGTIANKLSELYRANSNVMVYNLGISTKDEELILHESGAHVPNGLDRGLVSTVIPSEKIRWGNVEFKEVKATFLSYKSFLELSQSKYDYISIDAEGLDGEILKQIDLTDCRCLCIEYNRDEKLKSVFTEYCEKFDLRPVHRNAENIIFCR